MTKQYGYIFDVIFSVFCQQEDVPYLDQILQHLDQKQTEEDTSLLELSVALSIDSSKRLTDAYKANMTNTSCPEDRTTCHDVELSTMMTVMKENILQPHFLPLKVLTSDIWRGDYKDAIDIASSDLPFPLKKPLESNIDTFGNQYPFIPYCKLNNMWSNLPKWGSKRVLKDNPTNNSLIETLNKRYPHLPQSEFCTLFRPSLTDRGICYTFNSYDPTMYHKPSKYMEAFQSVFGLKSMSAFPKDKQVVEGTGIKKGLKVVLDAHVTNSQNRIMKRSSNGFLLSLQDTAGLALPVNEGLVVKGGYKYRY